MQVTLMSSSIFILRLNKLYLANSTNILGKQTGHHFAPLLKSGVVEEHIRTKAIFHILDFLKRGSISKVHTSGDLSHPQKFLKFLVLDAQVLNGVQ